MTAARVSERELRRGRADVECAGVGRIAAHRLGVAVECVEDLLAELAGEAGAQFLCRGGQGLLSVSFSRSPIVDNV